MGIPVGNIMQNGQPLHPGIQQPQMCPQSHPQFTQQVHVEQSYITDATPTSSPTQQRDRPQRSVPKLDMIGQTS